jgi:hypothetical protein
LEDILNWATLLVILEIRIQLVIQFPTGLVDFFDGASDYSPERAAHVLAFLEDFLFYQFLLLLFDPFEYCLLVELDSLRVSCHWVLARIVLTISDIQTTVFESKTIL